MSSIGRPTVLTENVVQKLEEALRNGFSVLTACHLSGVSLSTYYDHYDQNKEFSGKMIIAKLWITEQAKKIVIQAINSNDLSTAKWLLERRTRDEFGQDKTQRINGDVEDRYDKIDDFMRSFVDDSNNLPDNL